MIKRILIYVLVLCCIFLWSLYSIEKYKHTKDTYISMSLPKDTKAQIYIKDKTVYIKKADKETTTTDTKIKKLYPESSTTINIKDNDDIEISQNVFGVCFFPNIYIQYSKGLCFGFGTRFVFYRDFGIVSNIFYNTSLNNIGASIGVDYRLSNISLNNTSLYIGYSTESTITLGITIYLK